MKRMVVVITALIALIGGGALFIPPASASSHQLTVEANAPNRHAGVAFYLRLTFSKRIVATRSSFGNAITVTGGSMSGNPLPRYPVRMKGKLRASEWSVKVEPDAEDSVITLRVDSDQPCSKFCTKNGNKLSHTLEITIDKPLPPLTDRIPGPVRALKVEVVSSNLYSIQWRKPARTEDSHGRPVSVSEYNVYRGVGCMMLTSGMYTNKRVVLPNNEVMSYFWFAGTDTAFSVKAVGADGAGVCMSANKNGPLDSDSWKGDVKCRELPIGVSCPG